MSFLGDGTMNPRRRVSDETALAIDREVKDIVETAHRQAKDILTNNRDLLEEIAQQILETEVIEGEKLQTLLGKVQPVQNILKGQKISK
jgi:cell division protease FtsH